MDILAFVIAVVALAVSIAAFGRTGGIGMLRQRAEEARRLAANALGRVEEVIRPHQVLAQAGRMPETSDLASQFFDPAALQLIEEIAALHLRLGDPTLGARIPATPASEGLPVPRDSAR